MSTAQVILANDVPYVVDCANRVARQFLMAGVAPGSGTSSGGGRRRQI